MDRIVLAVAVVAAAYIVFLALLYVGRRLFLAGRIGMRGWVAMFMAPLLVAFVAAGFEYGLTWMYLATGILAVVAFWIVWRIMSPWLDDIEAFWQPADTQRPSAGSRRGWPFLALLAGLPGFAMLVVLVLIAMRDRAGT